MEDDKKLDEFGTLTKYFLDNFSVDLILGRENFKNKKEEIILTISNRVIDIYTIFYRLSKYPFYFEKLYIKNDLNITEPEILEYHIQNYLNDFYSLQEKIIRMLNYIKNNLREFNIDNRENIEKLIIHIKDNTYKGLQEVIKVRGSHVHDTSVRDPKISEAKLFLQVTQIVDSNKIAYTDRSKAEQNYLSLIKESKEKYIKQSKDNLSELNKFSKFLISRVGFLIATLYGHNTEQFKEILKDLD